MLKSAIINNQKYQCLEYYFCTGWETEPPILHFFQRDVRSDKIKKVKANIYHTRQTCPKSETVWQQAMGRFLSDSGAWGILQSHTSSWQLQVIAESIAASTLLTL